ncbi:DUF4360 domain-containing protein [Nannocystis radixulma]|uniref:DUF4360 domain-containing protein n=1 Tax=Nannocystis radixulma TaxID=2995305 RepID=A0ABT5B3M5_9BACT|nr:DUF4360 domain-containing protein [Nannocystis radixulma]MDC0668078.1 DUF4360 domain-containing protein [Nannocystis radixulma]
MLSIHTFLKSQAALLGLLASLGAPDREGDEPFDPGDSGVEREMESDPLEAQPPKGFAIESVTVGGSGCPNDSDVTVEKKRFRAVYHKMVLKNPPGPALKSTNCVVSLSLRIPEGWQVAPAEVGIRTSADLDDRITARATSKYFFAGDPLSVTQKKEFKGRYHDEEVHFEAIPEDSLVWSPCGEPTIFAFNASLQLNATKNEDGKGEVRVKAQRISKWRWRKC